MIKKQTNNTYGQLEKLLTVAGLAIIITGCIASIYGGFTNQRFINDFFFSIYYYRFLLLLGGGFAVGYLLANKFTRRSQNDRLFQGVVYALLAVTLYTFTFLAYFGLRSVFGDPSFPWSKILFMGMPILPIIAILAITYVTQYKSKLPQLSNVAKITLAVSFVAYEIYSLAINTSTILSGVAKYDPNTPVILIIASYFVMPLTVALISYLLLGGVKKWFDRVFYAALIAVFYSTLTSVLWEFRTDASAEATNIFHTTVTILTIILTTALLWGARKAIKK